MIRALPSLESASFMYEYQNPLLSIFTSLKKIVWPANTKCRSPCSNIDLDFRPSDKPARLIIPYHGGAGRVLVSGVKGYATKNRLLKSHYNSKINQITMSLSASHLLFVQKQIDNVTPSKFLLKSHSRKIWVCEDQARLVIVPRQ